MVEREALLRHHPDTEEGGIADEPGVVQQIERGLLASGGGKPAECGGVARADLLLKVGTGEARHIARVEGADRIADVVMTVEGGEVVRHPVPLLRGGGVVQRFKVAAGEGIDVGPVAGDDDPAAPVGGRVGIDIAGKTRITGGDITEKTVTPVPEGPHQRRIAVVVVRSRERGREHDQEGPDHRDAAKDEQRVDPGEEETRLGGFSFDRENDGHGGV